jgi:SAM-dependent methyltransferase
MARRDPLRAILTEGSTRLGEWDMAEFFRTGKEEIRVVMDRAEGLGYPKRKETALDFGCGVGRLTRALSAYFDKCYGVDISEKMVRLARELQSGVGKVEFLVNARADLKILDDGSVDMVYTGRVLQHLPGRAAIAAYRAEFVRILKPGGLIVCQIPTCLPLRYKLPSRRRLYSVLRAAGVWAEFLYKNLGLYLMRMMDMPETQAVGVFTRSGGRVLAAGRDTYAGAAAASSTGYVVRNEPGPRS